MMVYRKTITAHQIFDRGNPLLEVVRFLGLSLEKPIAIDPNQPTSVAKKKGKGKSEEGKNILKKHGSSVARVQPSGWRMVTQSDGGE